MPKIGISTWITLAVLAASIVATNAVGHYRLGEIEKRVDGHDRRWDKRAQTVQEFFRQYERKEQEDTDVNEDVEELQRHVRCLELTGKACP